MRSSVSYMLSHASGETTMSHPDYEQQPYHHSCLLVLIRGIGPSKPRSLQKIFERIQRVDNVRIKDSSGQVRDIWVRYIRDHPVENNDWGDFQTHRKLLGLITVGKFDTQTELNELCRAHESLKVKYTNTLYDSRCILFASNKLRDGNDSSGGGGGGGGGVGDDDNEDTTAKTTTTTTTTTSQITNKNGKNDSNSKCSELNLTKNNQINVSDSGGDTKGHMAKIIPTKITNNKNEYNNKENGTDADNLSNNTHAMDGEKMTKKCIDEICTTPSILQSRAFFYAEHDQCTNLEAQITEFINSLFWILESKRLERSREKVEKVALLLAPFEKKDFVGLDMDTRNMRKRCVGRVTKNLADLTLQSGLVAESLSLFHAASETLRAISDSLWLGAANEGLCAASAILLYPHLRHTMSLHRNASLQESSPQRLNSHRSSSQDSLSKHVLNKKTDLVINLDHNTKFTTSNTKDGAAEANNASTATSNSTVTVGNSTTITTALTTTSSSSASSASSNSSATSSATNSSSSASTPLTNNLLTLAQQEKRNLEMLYPANMLLASEIAPRYRDAIIQYSKYRHAGIIETEAALKAARICIEQNQNLDVAMFLQNVLYINLNMSEQERVQRFETLTELYQQIGYTRKAAFCQRLAAWRHVAQSNTNPDWGQSYRLMLESLPGHKLSLDPLEVIENEGGWPVLQIDLLQQLVFAARRLGQNDLATRHMTFLLQTMWKHLQASEQQEFPLQLQTLSAQCEGAPFPLFLKNGTTIPPANLTDLPFCEQFVIKDMPAHLRPQKIASTKVDSGPFLFTPIHFGSIDRRIKKNDGKVAFQWVQHDVCDILLRLRNPLPFELRVSDMRLLTNGIVFETIPETVNLSPLCTTDVILRGTPIETGVLEVQGYSTHTLGVKSNCRLKHMRKRTTDLPTHYTIDVVPALPNIRVTATFSPNITVNANADNASAHLTLYNGETVECTLTITNNSNIVVDFLEETIQSSLDAKAQSRMFTWSHEDLQRQLPLQPNESMSLKVTIFGDADFLGPISNDVMLPGGVNSLGSSGGMYAASYHADGVNSLTMSGHTSLPSRISSPTPNSTMQRRTELTSSFRSTHSSLATTSIGQMVNHGPAVRQIDAKFQLRYSGGDGLRDRYCRQCVFTFNMELLPSAHVTNWDVLPAEIASQFYLVLDVINLTPHEMLFNYTAGKNIVIEAKESCRVPVPVERCPIEKLQPDPNTDYEELLSNNMVVVGNLEANYAERASSEHISSQVHLKWSLLNTKSNGIASLNGITLSTEMLGLITIAPLQWQIFVDEAELPPQTEIKCTTGQSVKFGVEICNLSPNQLQQLTLSLQFYQDYQNGVCNYRLETRLTTSGPDHILIKTLNRNEKAFYECSAIFFTAGRYKADIKCSNAGNDSSNGDTQQQHTANTHALYYAINGINGNDAHTWQFIPAPEITVVE